MIKIFISYRRSDSKSNVGRLYDRLKHKFGKKNIFFDIHSIGVTDFRGQIAEAINQSDVLLVIIGQQWLTIKDENGNLRLNNPDDFVRLEVKAGLQRKKCVVIPVTINGAKIPKADELPEDLRQLAYENGFTVRDDPDFDHDINRLIQNIKEPFKPRYQKRLGIMIFSAILMLVLVGFAIMSFPKGENEATITLQTANIVQVASTEIPVVLPSETIILSVTPEDVSNTIYYQESFDDNVRGWILASNDNGEAHLSQGRLVVTANVDSCVTLEIPSTPEDQYYVEAVAQVILEADQGSANDVIIGFAFNETTGTGLVARYNMWGPTEWFTFFLENGEYLFKTTIPELWERRDPTQITIGTSYKDGLYTLFLNGQQMESGYFSTETTNPSLMVCSMSTSHAKTVAFDNVIVRQDK